MRRAGANKGGGAATGEMGPKSDAKRELQKKFGHVTAAA